jgi:glycosyltransferase involved in cell wall biosynthesis
MHSISPSLSDRASSVSPADTVTVVVPTYNRGEALRNTIEALLKSNAEQLTLLEIIVVDDGSPQSAKSIVDSYAVAGPFILKCLRQQNAGPAAARNTGFRESRGQIAIFIDDDIICPPDLIQQHIHAHQARPGSVIFGPSVLAQATSMVPLFAFINSLSYGVTEIADIHEFAHVDIPASGHISVQSDMFDRVKAVYRDDLSIPGAEEFELAYRLRQTGIPIFLSHGLVALHDQPINLKSFCRQQYKHALGTAEVMMKYPATRDLPALHNIFRANLESQAGLSLRTIKRTALKLLAISPVRSVGRLLVELIQYLCPLRRILMPLYRLVVSAYYYAGLRDGRRRLWT